MADNIKVTQGGGADPDVATNDKSGRHVQIVQLDLGGDTTVVELTGGQKAMSASLPVVIASDQGALSVALGAGSNNIGDVDVLSVPAPLSTAGNGTAATAHRVTIASDSTGVIGVTDNGGSLTVDGTITANAGTGTFTVGGVAAHDAAISGNPVRTGARAVNTDVNAVANGDAVDVVADLTGRQIVLQGGPHERHSNGTATYTTTTAADVIAAVASTRIAVTSILVTNAHATTGTKVEIRDGTTVVIQGFAAANGGGFALSAGGRPLFIGTASTAVTARCVTTGADVDVSIGGYRTV